MEITRRNLAAAGVLAIGAASLLQSGPAMADSTDATAVDKAVEALRKAQLEQDKARLEQLLADQLSYGHSDGKVDSKTKLIDGTMTRRAIVKSISFPELTVAVVGNAAIARHLVEIESETDGKPTSVKIGALQVWQKQDGTWKLLARQGFRLPQPA
jgi:ketosteroid isomerase-like protein